MYTDSHISLSKRSSCLSPRRLMWSKALGLAIRSSHADVDRWSYFPLREDAGCSQRQCKQKIKEASRKTVDSSVLAACLCLERMEEAGAQLWVPHFL